MSRVRFHGFAEAHGNHVDGHRDTATRTAGENRFEIFRRANWRQWVAVVKQYVERHWPPWEITNSRLVDFLEPCGNPGLDLTQRAVVFDV